MTTVIEEQIKDKELFDLLLELHQLGIYFYSDFLAIHRIFANLIGRDLEELKSKSRKAELVSDRQIYIELLYFGTKATTIVIGDLLSGRCHSTIHSARKAFVNDVNYNAEYREKVVSIFRVAVDVLTERRKWTN